MQNKKHIITVTFLVLVTLDIITWRQILFSKNDLSLYFLNVGQGDGSLVDMGVQVLIDGGRDSKILDEIKKVLPVTDRYIDLIVITHPDFDHYGGIINILKNYKVGAVLTNGLNKEIKAWQTLLNYIEKENIPLITLAEGDKIKYGKNNLLILSPNKKFLGRKEINNTSIVIKFESPKFGALFTGDIGYDVEKYLVNKFPDILKSDILKVPHHGSKYSSSLEFLKMVNPGLALIEVGKNSYGHPTKEVLNRLMALGVDVFRTDEDGTIKISNRRVFSSKN